MRTNSRLESDLSQAEYIIEATDLYKKYETGQLKVQALKGVSLKVQPGEIVAIMGPSGCGKTTLLNCLSSLDGVDSGTIKLAGYDLNNLTDHKLTAFRARQMGFIFQNFNLLPVLTALENVELPLLVGGVKPKPARKQALEMIEQVGLSAWARHRPAELSGGQRQRFTIARALATRPAIVWADEPTGALDSETGHEIVELMVQLNRQNAQTFVWVTHDWEVAAMARRVIKMRDGSIVEDRLLSNDKKDLG